MKTYRVVTLYATSLNEATLMEALNKEAAAGWVYKGTIEGERRATLAVARDAHFLIFERDVAAPPPPVR